jgi:hypothetical protein
VTRRDYLLIIAAGLLLATPSRAEKRVDMLRAGISVSTSPDDYSMFKRFQLVRFDGKSLRPIGDPISSD